MLKKGYNTCTVCAFENFKRFRFCTVCGEPILEKTDDEEQRGKGESAGEEKNKKPLLPMFGRKKHVQLTPSKPLPLRQATRRCLRARNRKEWTRKLDVEGRMYWFRDSRYAADNTLAAAFVAEFEPASGKQEETEGAAAVELSGDTYFRVDSLSNDAIDAPITGGLKSPVSDQELHYTDGDRNRSSSRRSVGSVEERTAALEKNVSSKHCKLRSTTDAGLDASKLSLDVQVGPTPTALKRSTSISLNESMTLIGKDFPSSTPIL